MEDKKRRMMLISKSLSYLLRHGGEREGLAIQSDGYINVNEVVRHNRLKSLHATVEEVKEVVGADAKHRFTLDHVDGGEGWLIRANQGHSIKVIADDRLLTRLTPETAPPVAIHGTSLKTYHDYIKHEGLSRMKRNHIHMAVGLPSSAGVISGMRTNCQVYIYINVLKGLNHGIPMYKSSNNVILTPGNREGFLPVEYFDKVTTSDGRLIS